MESLNEVTAYLSPLPLAPQDHAFISGAPDLKEEDSII